MLNSADIFDVLVVYSHVNATSASATSSDNNLPFSVASRRTHYNNAYGYLLETCAKHQLKAAFTTSADVIGAGLCNAYWLYSDNCWTKQTKNCFANVIFDKFSPASDSLKQSRNTLFSNLEITPFNDPELFSLFFDKQKSYQRFSRVSIPTVSINRSDHKNIVSAVTKLNRLVSLHPHREDFGTGVVLKDRYGSGGFRIYKLNTKIIEQIKTITQKHPHKSFIIQPFVQFDGGYQYKNLKGPIDIRLIFSGQKIIQTYIRMAKADDFRCNEHQGGSLTYIHKKDIPEKVIKLALKLAGQLNKPDSIYALDFIISNNDRVYFLEGNCGPGIDWNLDLLKNERMSKKLIRIIVKELKNRTPPPMSLR
jgi:glutathione synthase/RimK-type ligase-like ATP-grasp enzyme